MSVILNIDTATESASVSIAQKGSVINFTNNANQKDHASFLQPAIKKLLQEADLSINKLNAVAVTSGPGSYTGLRVGMASAKGLCYALHIPMITINTLQVIALSTIKQMQQPSALYCPLIDARRMEVFTAVYSHDLTEILPACSMILNEESFTDMLQSKKIYFSGSGALKLKNILKNKNAIFTNDVITPGAMAELSFKNYANNNFADVSYAAPFYLKEFYTQPKSGT